MTTVYANTNIKIKFVNFDNLGNGLGNVTVSFDGETFTFATNCEDRGAEPSRPEYDHFIEDIVAGDSYDEDNDQHVAAAEEVARRGIEAAANYAEVSWKNLD